MCVCSSKLKMTYSVTLGVCAIQQSACEAKPRLHSSGVELCLDTFLRPVLVGLWLHFWSLCPSPTTWIPNWCSSILLPDEVIQKRKIHWRRDSAFVSSRGFFSLQSSGHCTVSRSSHRDLKKDQGVCILFPCLEAWNFQTCNTWQTSDVHFGEVSSLQNNDSNPVGRGLVA